MKNMKKKKKKKMKKMKKMKKKKKKKKKLKRFWFLSFADIFHEITKSMLSALFRMMVELGASLIEYIYDDIRPGDPSYRNASIGLPDYYNMKQVKAIRFLHSGIYPSAFTDAFDAYYIQQSDLINTTLEDFVNQVYMEFNIEAGFYDVFDFAYSTLRRDFLPVGLTFYEETDMNDLSTDYMR